MKLNSASVPATFKPKRISSETSPEELQITEVQLQRVVTLLRVQELREGGGTDKLSFHLMRASACVLGDDVIFNGSKPTKRIYKRIIGDLLVASMICLLSSI